jgi:LmbE family N-acetylglucosaminyl deacetylase
MLPVSLTGPRTVLCLGAHADDIEVGCGGSLLRLVAAEPSLRVHWVVLSAVGERADEARAGAARFLDGAREQHVVVREFRDAYFPYLGGQVKAFIHELAAEVSPDLVFTHRRDDLHQDHRLVGELTWNAFRDHLILEYEIPKYDGDLGPQNVFVPLDEQTVERKIDLVMATYRSQHARSWFTPDTFRATLRLRGIESNATGGFAEGFRGRKLVLPLGDGTR